MKNWNQQISLLEIHFVNTLVCNKDVKLEKYINHDKMAM